jgi:hypothetical protein
MQGHSGGIVVAPTEPIRRGKVGCNFESIIYFTISYDFRESYVI